MNRSGIHINPANAGKLRKTLRAKRGKKLSVAALEKAKRSPNALTRKRANFALVARTWHHGGKRKSRR